MDRKDECNKNGCSTNLNPKLVNNIMSHMNKSVLKVHIGYQLLYFLQQWVTHVHTAIYWQNEFRIIPVNKNPVIEPTGPPKMGANFPKRVKLSNIHTWCHGSFIPEEEKQSRLPPIIEIQCKVFRTNLQVVSY